MDASTLHPECTLGRQTPVCRQLGHEAAFRADQGLRTRHGHRRLGNVVLSASLSGGRQWPTTVCCGHLSQMDTPLVQNMATRGIDRAWAVGITDPRRKATYQDLLFARVEVSHCNLPLVYEQEDSPTVLKGTQNAPWGARRRSAETMRGPLRGPPMAFPELDTPLFPTSQARSRGWACPQRRGVHTTGPLGPPP